MKNIIKKVQVNIPFRMLMDSYLEIFLDMELNPEIGIDAESLEKYSYDDFKKIADIFHAKGRTITVHGPFMDLCPTSVDPAIKEVSLRRFDQLLNIIPAIKPKTVVGHVGYDAKRLFYCKEEWEDSIAAFWKKVASGLNESGSQLVLENVYEHFPEDVLPVFEQLKPFNVGCCLDVGHLNVFSKTELSDWLTKLEPYIKQFHLHDNNGDIDLHLPPGKGNIDFHIVFDFIKRNKPILTLEPHEEEDLWQMLAFYDEHYSDAFTLL